MKYIKTYEKYAHTPQDKIDDMILMQEFADKFETQFEDILDIDYKSNIRFRTYLGFGADKQYEGQLTINNPRYYKTKKTIKYSIRIETDINPAGITGDDDIGRTFVIDFDIKQKANRYTKYPDFYSYQRNIDDVLQQFNEYLINTLNVKQPTEKEKQQRQLKKSMIKYNL